MENIVPAEIEKYITEHSSTETKNLADLNRETFVKVMMPQMLSGQVQGKFLEFISRMINPEYILEIGTYTGYSAICLAKGLKSAGKLITLDINEELTPMVKKYIALEKLEDKIEVLTGNAIQIIPTLTQQFDLVFIDADKNNYANYFDLVIEKVRPGGWILADNVLWSGKIIAQNMDKDTLAIDSYNKKIQQDPRVENVIISIRDGISIARKIG
ncbi:MAG: class I SAM-dependent methyltransferase [Bacteroidetes bacterium]|nr:class I SAM-dependent methyltransferase [Bacteroidota bacterium]